MVADAEPAFDVGDLYAVVNRGAAVGEQQGCAVDGAADGVPEAFGDGRLCEQVEESGDGESEADGVGGGVGEFFADGLQGNR